MSSSLQLLTTTELSALLKRNPETLVRWRRKRIGPPFLALQGRVLYDIRQVQAWLSSHSTSGARPKRAKQHDATKRKSAPLPATAPDAVEADAQPQESSHSQWGFSQAMSWQNTTCADEDDWLS